MFFHIITYIFLIIICVQDFRHRQVTWFLFPLVLSSLVLSNNELYNLRIILENWFYNIILIIVFLSVLLITFWLKYLLINRNKELNGKMQIILKKMFSEKLGIGDVLFFVVAATMFSPINFIIYLTGSFLLILLITALGKTLKNRTIPLAGYMACILLIIHLLCNLILHKNLYSNLNIL